MISDGAPNFTTSVIDTLRLSAKRRGLMGVVPWVAVITHAAPLVAVGYFGVDIDKTADRGDVLEVVATCTGVAGIITAFSVAAAGQVYQIASSYPFSDFLKKNGTSDSYLVSPQMIFSAQMLTVALGILCSISIILAWHQWWMEYAIAVFIGSITYEIILTWSLVDLMRKLTWHKADYETLWHDTPESDCKSKH